ncbi:MAG TPA: cytochrome c [Novosphingobium sp.]
MRSVPVLILPLLLGLSACGAPDTPGQRVANARHAGFEAIGDAFKDATDELKDPAPNLGELRVAAATINGLAPKVSTWFAKGSGPQDGVRTDALPAVWQKPAEFRQATERLVAAAASFHASAEAGELAAMREAAKGLGGACKQCHEGFREKD